MQPAGLSASLERLEVALRSFGDAYRAWLAGEADQASLLDVLAQAERDLDTARAELDRVLAERAT